MDRKNFFEVKRWVYINKYDNEFYEKCLKYDSQNVDYLIGLAKKYEKHSSKKANELYNKILEINPYNYTANQYFKRNQKNPDVITFRSKLFMYFKRNVVYYMIIFILVAAIYNLLTAIIKPENKNASINKYTSSSELNTNIYMPEINRNISTITENIKITTYDMDEIIKVLINTSDDLRKRYPNFNINITGCRDNIPIVKLTWNNFQSRDIRFLGTETISGTQGSVELSIIKSSVLAYYYKNKSFPNTLEDMVKNFPDNILSQIPKEPVSGINTTFNTPNEKGGWVYNKPQTSFLSIHFGSVNEQKKHIENLIRQAVSPNIKNPYEDIGFLKIIFTDKNLYLCNTDNIIIKKYPLGFARTNPYGVNEILTVNMRIIPKDKNTPLGTGLLGLSRDNLAIHGTNNPQSIGKNLSAGCLRLRNKDIDELYKIVPLFTEVQYKRNFNETNNFNNDMPYEKENSQKSKQPQIRIAPDGNKPAKKIFESPNLKIKWRF